jgi:hypothetical protein
MTEVFVVAGASGRIERNWTSASRSPPPWWRRKLSVVRLVMRMVVTSSTVTSPTDRLPVCRMCFAVPGGNLREGAWAGSGRKKPGQSSNRHQPSL